MTFLTFQMAMGVTMYAPELFPTEYRLRGNAIGNMTGRIASMLAPAATVPLFTKFGVSGVTVTLAALCVVVSAIVAAFGVETRQKSLEGIAKVGNGIPGFVKGTKGSSESPVTGRGTV
jgi:putative MFS transporter